MWKLTNDQKLSENQKRYGGVTLVNVEQSDIRAVARMNLMNLYKLIKTKKRSAKGIAKAHLEDTYSGLKSVLNSDN